MLGRPLSIVPEEGHFESNIELVVCAVRIDFCREVLLGAVAQFRAEEMHRCKNLIAGLLMLCRMRKSRLCWFREKR